MRIGINKGTVKTVLEALTGVLIICAISYLLVGNHRQQEQIRKMDSKIDLYVQMLYLELSETELNIITPNPKESQDHIDQMNKKIVELSETELNIIRPNRQRSQQHIDQLFKKIESISYMLKKKESK